MNRKDIRDFFIRNSYLLGESNLHKTPEQEGGSSRFLQASISNDDKYALVANTILSGLEVYVFGRRGGGSFIEEHEYDVSMDILGILNKYPGVSDDLFKLFDDVKYNKGEYELEPEPDLDDESEYSGEYRKMIDTFSPYDK